MEIDYQIERWERLYKDQARFEVDLSSVPIPKKQKGFDRLIVVPQQLADWNASNAFYAEYDGERRKIASINEREPKDGTYAVWTSDSKRIEIPEGRINRTKVINSLTIKTETLLERILHEAIFWNERGRRPLDDDQGLTICAGSRGKDGRAPYFMWYHRLFNVAGCAPSVRVAGNNCDDIRYARTYVIPVIDINGKDKAPLALYWDI